MSNYESKPPSIGLWANDRGPMASGNCGSIRFVLWKNDSDNPKAPAYRLVLEQAQKREDGPQGGGSQARDTRSPQDRYTDASKGGGGGQDDDIPF